MINLIKKRLEKAIGGRLAGEIEVSATDKPEFGHYSSNAAFKLAPILKKSPFQIAQDLASSVMRQASGQFEKVVAVQPGFINFWLAPSVLQERVNEILKKRQATSDKRQGLKINVEFVSANPTGPLTMANGRGGFYGDVLANVLEKAGNKVTREYYINDAGNQIKILGESILAAMPTGRQEKGFIDKKENHYQGAYIKNLATSLKRQVTSDANPEEIGKKAAGILIKQIKASLKKSGIKHDIWFSENKKLRGKKGLINKILESLMVKGLVIEKDGAKWLKNLDTPTPQGDRGSDRSVGVVEEKDRVLVKSDGQPTYFLSDMAYHYDKFINRKFNLAIDIWGADHHGYIARLKSGVKAIGINPDRLKIIITQMVRLMSKGKEIKMSKRTGEFITMDELLSEVGADAARFFFLMHSADTHMDFDLDLAKERSQKNPVYYAQYALVRAAKILQRTQIANRKGQITRGKSPIGNLRLLKSESEMRLMLELVKLPDLIEQTVKDYQVHRLTKYASELARAFHNFYEKERVIEAPEAEKQARLALVSATKIVLENLFDVLGISKPKKM